METLGTGGPSRYTLPCSPFFSANPPVAGGAAAVAQLKRGDAQRAAQAQSEDGGRELAEARPKEQRDDQVGRWKVPLDASLGLPDLRAWNKLVPIHFSVVCFGGTIPQKRVKGRYLVSTIGVVVGKIDGPGS